MRRLILPTAFLIATAALAHEGVLDPQVEARMDAMVTLQDGAKTLGAMAKGVRAFDADEVRAALDTMREAAAETPELFEDEADDPKSEARDTIWQEWEAFVKLNADLSAALADPIPAEADLRPALAEIGAACGACHERFRE